MARILGNSAHHNALAPANHSIIIACHIEFYLISRELHLPANMFHVEPSYTYMDKLIKLVVDITWDTFISDTPRITN